MKCECGKDIKGTISFCSNCGKKVTFEKETSYKDFLKKPELIVVNYDHIKRDLTEYHLTNVVFKTCEQCNYFSSSDICKKFSSFKINCPTHRICDYYEKSEELLECPNCNLSFKNTNECPICGKFRINKHYRISLKWVLLLFVSIIGLVLSSYYLIVSPRTFTSWTLFMAITVSLSFVGFIMISIFYDDFKELIIKEQNDLKS